MDLGRQFEEERTLRIEDNAANPELQALSRDWLEFSMRRQYVYNFSWLGRPIIQYPQDMVAIQELIWTVRPDLIVETGIAHGGSLILSASMLALLDVCDAAYAGTALNPAAPRRRVLGIDIDIRAHNRQAIERHPLSPYIQMIQGSSVDPMIISQVHAAAAGYTNTMVILDSMHTHEHVLGELTAYAPLVMPSSYCVVFDTFIERMPPGSFNGRPWDLGNNPATAVREFLHSHAEFTVDSDLENKLLITAAPGGFLKRIH
jgi:cephalosporin hydroxylase